MSTTLREALSKIDVPMSKQEISVEDEALKGKHRSRNVLKRPDKKVELHAMLPDDFEPRKEQRDPTDELVILPRIVNDLARSEFEVKCEEKSYIIYCSWSEDTWWAPSRLCLDKNFIYRNDLEIYEVHGPEEAYKKAAELTKDLYPGVLTSKICYILDDPVNESYEVYHDASLPKIKYGKSTPDGMIVQKYKNRFHRDMSIMELDTLYSEQSLRKAGKLMVKGYDEDEAIIISDGCWSHRSCSSSFVYLDNNDVVKFTKGFLPSDEEQSVVIAEITGAKEAISYAISRGKTKITYYYDNTAIINVFRNRRMQHLKEVVEYRSMLEKIDKETNIQIVFVDIHPKIDGERQDENRALMYFHNMCDSECRKMAWMYKKDYKAIATNGGKNGNMPGEVINKFKSKGKARQFTGGRYKGKHSYSIGNGNNSNRCGKRSYT